LRDLEKTSGLVHLERIVGVSGGVQEVKVSLAQVNNLITGLLDLKIHSIVNNFEE